MASPFDPGDLFQFRLTYRELVLVLMALGSLRMNSEEAQDRTELTELIERLRF